MPILPDAQDAATPPLECDIVLKGGVTSGIVYPLALVALARTYRFRSIGGTSAGAIAAAATAAAEYGRRHGRGAGFARLAALPTELGTDGRLARLFQPARGLGLLLDLGLFFTGARPAWQRLAGALALATLLLLAPLLAGNALIGALARWSARPMLAPLAGAALLALALALVAWLLARAAARALERNGWGLCSGMTVRRDAEALTPWLHRLLQEAAGLPEDEPLTHGHLAGDPTREEPDIRLEMMTTALSLGRPLRMPFEDGRADTDMFYFDPAELARLFPRPVVDWMVRHARDPHEGVDPGRLLRLPAAEHLPVLLGVRMSLSFPLLLSAVPLHAAPFDPARARERRVPRRCWFSDGGICSNFPIHLFDGPLPRRPTFGINLRPWYPEDGPVGGEPDDLVTMPHRTSEGLAEQWYRFGAADAGSLARLGGFMGSVFYAMQNWRDNAQLQVPGFRDRVVHVYLDESREGGLNLAMPDALVRTLAARGEAAGHLLVARYARGPQPPGIVCWDTHRWTRYRTTMRLLDDTLARMRTAFRWPDALAPTYEERLRRLELPDETTSYPWADERTRLIAADATAELLELGDTWRAGGARFGDGAPKPAPELRVSPRT
ncbi:MAG: patatin-like phospholipase family protein [Gemmatimonadales bacterium]|nr:patatin-like phospholipase family protein [Gemmatimonadales bacterium]